MKNTYRSIITLVVGSIVLLSGCEKKSIVVNNYYITNSDGSVSQTQLPGEENSETTSNTDAASASSEIYKDTTSTDEKLVVGVKYSVKVSTNYLALRNAPSFDASNEIAKLNNDDEVLIKSQTVYGDKYEYCYVSVISGSAAGKEGYVNKSYLQKDASKPSVVTSAAKPDTNGTYTVYTVTGTTNFLAVRTEPIYDGSNIIYKLNNGDRVYVYSTQAFGDKGEYWYIKVPGSNTEGYVNKNYITLSTSTANSSETESQSTASDNSEKSINSLSEFEYSSLIEGNLTKPQLELVLSRLTNDIVKNGMSDSESKLMALYFTDRIINTADYYGLSYYGMEKHWAKIKKDDMNKLFASFGSYVINENDYYKYNDESKETYADDTVLYVALASTSDFAKAEIYNIEYKSDELKISYHYSYLRSGTNEIHEERTAVLHKTNSGLFRIDAIQ